MQCKEIVFVLSIESRPDSYGTSKLEALYVYLSEYHSGKRVLELSYEDVKSAKNGLIVITPDFDNFTAKLIAADEDRKSVV